MTRSMLLFLSRSLLLSTAFLLLTADASGQYFGRNKVQWERFDFKVLRTPHFDIYYYDESAPVIDDVGRVAERWYERLSTVFNHEFARKPIVMYANHPDFQQTTTTGGFIGEGTGGFTDSIQNRIVMPLTASFAETDHIIGHEMVHVFQYDISNSQGQRAGQQRFRLEQLPLWMIEGLAEYLSQGRVDPQTAMWMRDATLNDLLPDVRELSRDPRLSPYHYGQAFWSYIGGRYGDGRVIDVFLASGLYGIEQAFVRVLGTSAEQVFADWHAATRLQYEPVVLRRWPEARLGSPVITEASPRTINVSPAVSPDGRWIAFLSSRELFSIGLFLADTSTGEVVATLASAAANPHIDALRFIDSSGTWSPDGSKFAFVVFEKGDNRLAILDVASRRIERRINVPGVEGLSNPAWSPDGRTIALSGQARGVTDLFLYDVESGEVRQLTNDRYTDIHPAWSPDGRTIAFSSDRGPETDFARLSYGKLQIATIDVGSEAVSVLSLLGNASHRNPQYSPDGETIYFIADPEGSADIFRHDLSGGIRRITNVVTGVSGIVEMSPALSVAAQTGQIYYSLFHKARYDIYTVASGDLAGEPVTSSISEGAAAQAGILPPPTEGEQGTVASYLDRPAAGLPPSNMEFSKRDYSSPLRLTYVGPPTIGIGADTQGAAAFGGSVSAYFSDVLGIHNVGVSIQGGSSSSSLGSAIGAELVYLNRGQRVHYGAAASHIPYVSAFTTVARDTVIVDGQEIVADIFQQRREIVTVDQLSLLSQYPFGLTRRVEVNGGYLRYGFDVEVEQIIAVGNRVIDRQTFNQDAPEALDLYQGSAAFVGDSSFFGFVSPISGTRYRYEAGAVTGDLDYQTGLADWRKYMFRRPFTLAMRGLFFGRFGDDAESGRLRPLFIGNSALVRGYEAGSFNPEIECSPTATGNGCPEFDRLVGSRIGIAGLELRVPLFGTEELGLINLPFLPTELVGFVDAGAAWTKDESADFTFETDTTARVPVVSAGIAARILLGGYIPIELYYAYPFQRPEESGVFGFAIHSGW